MLRNLLSQNQNQRALVFDPLKIMAPGLVIESRLGLERWFDANGLSQRFRVIYRPAIDEANFEGLLQESDFFCWVGRCLENVDLFFDEVDSFSSPDKTPPELHAVLNFGRRLNISVRGAVRRPQVKIPRDWITEATRFTIFRTCDPSDAIFLQRYTGIPNEEILKLERFEFFEWMEGDISRGKLEKIA